MSQSSQSPIGVFDSGVGGLTVVRHLLERSPIERIIYFGDTARVPYGTKSADTIRRYAEEDARFLLEFAPKLLVVACNTVSALALDVVQKLANPIPVVGVLNPGARMAALASKTGRIGILGTAATVASGAYERAILEYRSDAKVISMACPLFVPLAEEGLFDHPATHLIAREYLLPLMESQIDTLVLGCTHYPLLKPTLSKILGDRISIIDSGAALTELLTPDLLSSADPHATPREPEIFVSDLPLKFQKLAEQFLGRKLESAVNQQALGAF